MKKFTALALVAGLAAAGSAQAQYQVEYDPADGSLTIKSDGPLINYVLESATDSFIGANHTPILGGTAAGTAGTVSESNPFGAVPAGEYGIGNVLPTGLDPAGFADATASFSAGGNLYTTALGQPKQEFEFVYVPEPTSLALLGLGGLLVARRRRSA